MFVLTEALYFYFFILLIHISVSSSHFLSSTKMLVAQNSKTNYDLGFDPFEVKVSWLQGAAQFC